MWRKIVSVFLQILFPRVCPICGEILPKKLNMPTLRRRMQDRTDGSLKELMLIRSYKDLQEVCDANHIDAATVRKIY